MRLFETLCMLSAATTCWARAEPGPPHQEPLRVPGLEPQRQSQTKHLSLTHDLIGFHRNLTEIESITGNERGVGEWLADSLEAQGYHVEKQYVEKKPVRFNVLAWPGEKRDAQVLVSSHIDTVCQHLPSHI